VLFAIAKYQRVSRLVQSVHTGHYRVCRFKGFTTPEENGRWTFRVTLSSVSGILNKISQGGETGRRTGLKIRSPARGVWVRFPSLALTQKELLSRLLIFTAVMPGLMPVSIFRELI